MWKPVFVAVLALVTVLAPSIAQAEGSGFWDSQRTGANSFNRSPDLQQLGEARRLGLGFIRLTFTKWASAKRDFLIGDVSDYRGLVQEDLKILRGVLDGAAKQGIGIILTPLSLPGSRWRQFNGAKDDLRLWRDKTWWDQAAAFWKDLALELDGHPAVVGFNILNEPAPELGSGLAEEAGAEDRDTWCKNATGTAADLDAFYRKVVASIRSADASTPIILDAGFYTQPMAIRCLKPIDDGSVLYSVHLYEPYEFTSHFNKGKFQYPGDVTYGEKTEFWDRERLQIHLAPLLDWAREWKVPTDRLMIGEFGCYRRNRGCATYLSDTITILNEKGLHWAFYGFREDEWDGYDYEVGTGPLPDFYWDAVDRGETPTRPRPGSPMSDVIRAGLAPPPAARSLRSGQ